MADPSQIGELRDRGSGTDLHPGLGADSDAAPAAAAVTGVITEKGLSDG